MNLFQAPGLRWQDLFPRVLWKNVRLRNILCVAMTFHLASLMFSTYWIVDVFVNYDTSLTFVKVQVAAQVLNLFVSLVILVLLGIGYMDEKHPLVLPVAAILHAFKIIFITLDYMTMDVRLDMAADAHIGAIFVNSAIGILIYSYYWRSRFKPKSLDVQPPDGSLTDYIPDLCICSNWTEIMDQETTYPVFVRRAYLGLIIVGLICLLSSAICSIYVLTIVHLSYSYSVVGALVQTVRMLICAAGIGFIAFGLWTPTDLYLPLAAFAFLLHGIVVCFDILLYGVESMRFDSMLYAVLGAELLNGMFAYLLYAFYWRSKFRPDTLEENYVASYYSQQNNIGDEETDETDSLQRLGAMESLPSLRQEKEVSVSQKPYDSEGPEGVFVAARRWFDKAATSKRPKTRPEEDRIAQPVNNAQSFITSARNERREDGSSMFGTRGRTNRRSRLELLEFPKPSELVISTEEKEAQPALKTIAVDSDLQSKISSYRKTQKKVPEAKFNKL